ncbi:hypothetical protein DOE73_08610 [Paenibacillus dendritiformis]|nr:hypothetical protein DOE73_08610 [Paenibacillus dendritiformis]
MISSSFMYLLNRFIRQGKSLLTTKFFFSLLVTFSICSQYVHSMFSFPPLFAAIPFHQLALCFTTPFHQLALCFAIPLHQQALCFAIPFHQLAI